MHILVLLRKYIYAIAAAIALFAVGPFSHSGRTSLHKLAVDLGWKGGTKKYPILLPDFDPSPFFIGGLSLSIYDPVGQAGNVTLLELVTLNALISIAKPKTIFEFGTFDGRTALNFAANCSPDCKIYTLDLSPQEMENYVKTQNSDDAKFTGTVRIGYKYKNSDSPVKNKIISLEGNSSSYNFSTYEKTIDFTFIDAGHSYFFVDSDTKNALMMLRKGGIIAWHDYRSDCEGVTRVLNDLYAQGGIFKNMRRIKGTNLAVLLPDSLLNIC